MPVVSNVFDAIILWDRGRSDFALKVQTQISLQSGQIIYFKSLKWCYVYAVKSS